MGVVTVPDTPNIEAQKQGLIWAATLMREAADEHDDISLTAHVAEPNCPEESLHAFAAKRLRAVADECEILAEDNPKNFRSIREMITPANNTEKETGDD